jgi:GDP-4-dehydro-6-deoxy-D-mannose reductase
MTGALVFAGTSFIGRHLIDRLRREKVETTTTARRPAPGCQACDLTDFQETARVIAAARPRWVVQCAGATTVGTRAEMDHLHVEGTRNVLHAVANHVPEATVILFGSAAEYGNVPATALPVREDQPLQPRSAFGCSKLAQTQLAGEVAAALGLRVCLLRPFNVVGPGTPEHYLAGALAKRLQEGVAGDRSGAFAVNNAQATRDWVDVRDVAEAVVSLLVQDLPQAGCMEVYNVATGIETTVLAVADALCRRSGRFQAVAGSDEPDRSGVLRSCGDWSRLGAATGWRPRISWQQSLADLWDALPAVSSPLRG